MDPVWTCDECKTSFDRSKLLEQHAQEAGHAAYRCFESACNKTFRARPSWVRHEKSHINKARYTCSLCNKKFQRKDNFDDHVSRCIRRAGRSSILETPIYDRDATERALNDVLQSLIPRPKGSQFRCPIPDCGQLSTGVGEIRYHLLLHIVEESVNDDSPIARALDCLLPKRKPRLEGSIVRCPLDFCQLHTEAWYLRAHLLIHVRDMGLTVLRDLGLDRKTIMEEYTSQVTRRRTAPAQAIVYAQDAELAQDTGLAQDTEPVQGTDLVQMSAELPQPSLAVASLRRNLEQDTTTTRNVNIKTSHSNPANVSLIGRVFGSLQQSPVGSLMSWKPMSWGSLIQQDTKMTGTTPSSYDVFSGSQLAKAEAKHMRDYVCCGMHFKNLHELLEHHESSHPMKFR